MAAIGRGLILRATTISFTATGSASPRAGCCGGAGFLVVLTGDILRMPGLARQPLAESLDLVGDDIVGLA
jgi:hypothetical protein